MISWKKKSKRRRMNRPIRRLRRTRGRIRGNRLLWRSIRGYKHFLILRKYIRPCKTVQIWKSLTMTWVSSTNILSTSWSWARQESQYTADMAIRKYYHHSTRQCPLLSIKSKVFSYRWQNESRRINWDGFQVAILIAPVSKKVTSSIWW